MRNRQVLNTSLEGSVITRTLNNDLIRSTILLRCTRNVNVRRLYPLVTMMAYYVSAYRSVERLCNRTNVERLERSRHLFPYLLLG